MANCTVNAGYTFPCFGIGGVYQLFIGNYNGTAMTMGLTADGSIISFGGATVSFYTFNQEAQVGSFAEVPVVNKETGTTVWTQTVEMTIIGLSQANNNLMDIIARGRVRIIVLDNEGLYWLVGQKNPVYVSGGDAGPHKAHSDLYGYTLTFEGSEKFPAVQVSAAAAASVITT